VHLTDGPGAASADHQLKLTDRYEVTAGRIYLSGLQALVRLPVDVRRHDQRSGRRTAAFISGYEGSPLAGYDLELTRRAALLREHGIVFQPAVNEELAVSAVQGSQLAALAADRKYEGVAGYWYGKAPGLDRASDALRHANLGGTSQFGGALAVVGDDATAKSSTVPSSSEMALSELGLPVLVPADPQDILDLGVHGVALSRFCGLWVGFKIATNVADGSAVADVDPSRITVTLPDNVVDGRAYRHQVSAHYLQPVLGRLEHSQTHERLELARRYAAANGLNRISGGPDATIGIVAGGSTYLDVRQALDLLGLPPAAARQAGIRILRLGLIFPLEPGIVAEFADGLEEIVVVEEKRAFVETAVKDLLYGRPGAPAVSGKKDPSGAELLRPDGDLGAERIADALAARLLARGVSWPGVTAWTERRAAPEQPRRTALPLVSRTPFFCSGCPHNRSTEVPDGALVGGGIGCSAIVMFLPEERVGTMAGLTQMGGEGAAWIGMAPFVGTPHLFQNIGDGTFYHSGSLAVRAAVAAGSNITYKLLYNSTVAMTGGQDAVGAQAIPDVTRLLAAEGVRRIVITTEHPEEYRGVALAPGTTVRPRRDLLRVQEELAAVSGVTVLLHDQECATELRRKRKRGKAAEPDFRAFINERVCEGCGDCGEKSNCASVQPVQTEYGRKTQIHQPSCNKDFSCLDGDCPAFLTVVPGQAPRSRRALTALAAEQLPEPRPTVDPDRFSVRITGIGGTGVVTVAQVLATAASMGGRSVRGLDQTGLAQKGGAVVSDIKVTARPAELSHKIADGECDLYLGCDVLVAAAEGNLSAADPSRTVAVVSTAEVPTGSMVTDTSARFPSAADTLGRIADRVRGDAGKFVDARAATRALFGDDQYANTFLLGVAYQLGALPVPAEHIEAAIELNGVGVEANRQAFRRGRQLIADPGGFDAALGGSAAGPAGEPERLDDLIAGRAAELRAYQDDRYARRYTEFVTRVRAAESAAQPGATELTRAVARYLFKLMAYKDEYEVARLSLDPALEARVADQFGPDATYRYRLHPPLLRALGLRRKISLGPWFRPVFAGLYAARRVRGSRLDPFGYAAVRRTERTLIDEYRMLVDGLLDGLTADSLPAVAGIAALPDLVRGYESVKLGNVARYRDAVAAGLAGLDVSRPLAAAAD
jgi:indolepyruvate ferredoxin oxidoreductase